MDFEAYVRKNLPQSYFDLRVEMLSFERGWQALKPGQKCFSRVSGFGGGSGVPLVYQRFVKEGDVAGQWTHPWNGELITSRYGDDLLIFTNREGHEFGVRPVDFVARILVEAWYDEVATKIEEEEK